MLCSKCNEPIRPVVALDIDGTLAQWHKHFFWFASGYFNRTFAEPYNGLLPIAEHMKVSQEEYRQCKLAFRQGGLKRTMPMFPGADQLVSALKTLGADVWITTTRPYLRLDNTDPDTREWLDRNCIQYDGLLYDEDKYAVLVERVGAARIAAVLEDDPECYDRALDLEIRPILMLRTHNRFKQKLVMAKTMKEAKDLLIKRVTRWKDSHVEHFPNEASGRPAGVPGH